jgi:hypothetical protein
LPNVDLDKHASRNRLDKRDIITFDEVGSARVCPTYVHSGTDSCRTRPPSPASHVITMLGWIGPVVAYHMSDKSSNPPMTVTTTAIGI